MALKKRPSEPQMRLLSRLRDRSPYEQGPLLLRDGYEVRTARALEKQGRVEVLTMFGGRIDVPEASWEGLGARITEAGDRAYEMAVWP